MKSHEENLAIIRQHSRRTDPIPSGQSPVLVKLPNIDAVLFDVYGTLFVSASGDIGAGDKTSHETAFAQALASAGLDYHPHAAGGVHLLHDAICRSHERSRESGVGFPEVDIVEIWRETLDQLLRHGLVAEVPDPVDIKTISLEYELLTNPVWPMPGAAECLTALASHGVRLGVVSNGQWFTPLLFPALLGGDLEAFGFAADMQFWSHDTGRAKPGEFMYRHAAKTLNAIGISSDRVLHVGNDMLNDVLPAAKTGFRTALFAGDQRSLRRREDDPRVSSVSPDLVVLNLRDLVSCVRPGVKMEKD